MTLHFRATLAQRRFDAEVEVGPRERVAISVAPSGSMGTPSRRAERLTIVTRSASA